MSNDRNNTTSDTASSYYLDRVRINCQIYPNQLKRILPLDKLEEQAKSFLVDTAYKPAFFKSRIDIVVPTQRCIELLCQIDRLFQPYKISYIEIARDRQCHSDSEAELAIKNSTRTIRKKYSGKFVFDGTDKKKDIQKGLLTDKTYYYGSVKKPNKSNNKIEIRVGGKFRYVMYDRDSKIDGKPVAHEEWRILNAQTIFQKTGIRFINNFLEINLEDVFENLAKQYLTHETLNRRNIGYWILGWERRRKLSQRELMKAGFTGQLFCKIHHIKTSADLVTFFKGKKNEINSKLGRRSDWDNKILSIKNYSKFFNTYNNDQLFI